MAHSFTRRASFAGFLGVFLPWPVGRLAARPSSPDMAPASVSATRDHDQVSVRDTGARGDGITDDTAAFSKALDSGDTIYVPGGHYRIGAIGSGEYQKALHVRGTGAASVLELGQRQRPTLQIGAVGGEFGDVRSQTIIELMTFKRAINHGPPYSYTALDIRAVHPYAIRDIVMLNLGPDALKLTSCYYGLIGGLSLANSGLTLKDVNNCSITGSDIRPDEFGDKSRGAALFGRQGRYPINLSDSDHTMFVAAVIEGWECPAMLLRRSRNTVLRECWLEGLCSPTHVIRWEEAGSLEIVNSWLDFSIPYGECFIELSNSGPFPGSTRLETSQIRIDGGTLIAASRSFGDAGKFVKVVGQDKARVLVEGVTFGGGCLRADRSVDFDIRSITLSGPLRHYLYSIPNARMERERNSWMPESVRRDWDFSKVDMVPVSDGLSIARTGEPGEFLTGTGGIRVIGFEHGTRKAIKHSTKGQMGPVTRRGQSYLVFVRVKCDRDVTLKIEINGGFVDFAAAPPIELPSGGWRDILFKTQEDVTWAQGRFSPPEIILYLDNQSGESARLFIDRIDYMIAAGDHAI